MHDYLFKEIFMLGKRGDTETIYMLLEYCRDWIYDLVCWLFSL